MTTYTQEQLMDTYRVISGTIDIIIEAKNHKMAVIKAIDQSNPQSLGLIVSVIKDGETVDEDEIFMRTENVLHDMGYEVTTEYLNENSEETELPWKDIK